LEAIIFCASEPISQAEIKTGLDEFYQINLPEDLLEKSIEKIREKFSQETYAIELMFLGGGYQFLTKPAFQPSVGAILKQKVKKRLSTSAMETLAIVAYKQPVSKPEIEKIRGVNCDYAIQKLLEKELIEIAGKAETAGKPSLYRTSKKFMDYFGINHINQLPDIKDFQVEENTIGSEVES
jgi:segregation and condensation protein B